jgi:hypothetical protein
MRYTRKPSARARVCANFRWNSNERTIAAPGRPVSESAASGSDLIRERAW